MSAQLRGRRLSAAVCACCCTLAVLSVVAGALVGGRAAWYASSAVVVVCAVASVLASFEARRPDAREVVLVAVMAALAVASRAAFAWLPGFKPTCGVVMLAGLGLGPQAGFVVGALAMLVSNFMFGQGPWTPWQMLAFGLAGLAFGLVGRARRFPRGRLSRPQLVCLALGGSAFVACVVGPVLDTSSVFTMLSVANPGSALAIYAAGVPFNLVHGLATAATLLLLGNPLLVKLARVRRRYGIGVGRGPNES